MKTNAKTEKEYRRELSLFAKWEIGIIITVIAVIAIYLVISGFGIIADYQALLENGYDDALEHGILTQYNIVLSCTFIIIAITAILYIAISIYILLSHRSVEDCRLHCLPIMISPIFLVIENGFLHVFGGNYYEVMMSVFSATVVGVITFASLKFSFELSTQKKRLSETSNIKPTIKVLKSNKTTDKGSELYIAEISQHECYFSGAYIGTIDKIFYRDIKKTGNHFAMRALFYPNVRVFLQRDSSCDIDYSECDMQVNEKYQDFLYAYDLYRLLDKSIGFYWIFRDTQNFYYFVQMPTETVPYNVIGVNEHMMTRLLYYHNENIYKQKNDAKIGKKVINYKAMDWFKIPYNFYPNNPCNQI